VRKADTAQFLSEPGLLAGLAARHEYDEGYVGQDEEQDGDEV
jgi:hypothetical protein